MSHRGILVEDDEEEGAVGPVIIDLPETIPARPPSTTPYCPDNFPRYHSLAPHLRYQPREVPRENHSKYENTNPRGFQRESQDSPRDHHANQDFGRHSRSQNRETPREDRETGEDRSFDQDSRNRVRDNLREARREYESHESHPNSRNQFQENRSPCNHWREPPPRYSTQFKIPESYPSDDDLDPHYQNRPLAPGALLHVIRRWNVIFSGHPGEDVESFIARVDEGKAFINTRERDFMRAITFLLEGSALNWYRGHAGHLQTWDDLKDALRRSFADPDYQLALREEISRRTQGDRESVRDYFSNMRGYFNRLLPRWSELEKVRHLHRMMLPVYQLGIPLRPGLTMDELEMSAMRQEKIYDSTSERRPPPRPEHSICPSLAFRAPSAPTRPPFRGAACPPLTSRIRRIEESDDGHSTPRSERSRPSFFCFCCSSSAPR